MGSFSNDKPTGNIAFREITTPGYATGVYKIYIKSDGNLYTLDGSGNEIMVNMAGKNIAEMGMAGESTAVTIDTADEDHMLGNLTAGELDGFTKVAAVAGSIASVVTSDAGATITCTDVAHGLTTGDIISVTGSSSVTYNGVYVVTVLTVDTFKVTVAYVATATATWAMGGYLLAGANAAGTYKASISGDISSAVADKNFRVSVYINGVVQDNVRFELSPGNTLPQNGFGNGYIDIVAGDRVSIAIQNITDTTNCTPVNINLTLQKT